MRKSHLECLPAVSTIRPGLESDPAARLGPADHRRIHSCPAHPIPKPICLREGQANSYSAGARLAWQEELAATALASLTPALLKGQCCSPLALFPSAGRAGPTMGQGPRDIIGSQSLLGTGFLLEWNGACLKTIMIPLEYYSAIKGLTRYNTL